MRTIRSGFTIAELAVVIAIIGILAAVSTLSFIEMQRQARDSQREAHAAMVVNELEKYFDENGTYPAGCLYPNCSADRPGFYAYANGAPWISSSANPSDLQSRLPGLPSDFGDPQLPDGQNPMYAQGIAGIRDKRYHYIYAGGLVSSPLPRPSAGGTGGGLAADTVWRCGWDHNPDLGSATTGADNVSSFIFAYYSESANKWMVYRGSRGVPMKMSTNAACIDTIEYKS